MLKLKSCFLFLLLLIGTCAYGQYFKKIGINDGLSNLSVMSICQDTLGRMWFGTMDGINIYDGAKIEKIKYCEVVSEQGKIRKFTFRIYLSGTNLLTFSKFKLWDPEMAGDGLGYPIQKTYNIGLQLSF